MNPEIQKLTTDVPKLTDKKTLSHTVV
jgi:hypothetical protein